MPHTVMLHTSIPRTVKWSIADQSLPSISQRSEIMLQPTCRRSFLKSTALGASAIGLNAIQYSRVYGANGRMGIASVGVGGKGWSDLNGVAASPNVEVIALCDIDSSEKHLGRAAANIPLLANMLTGADFLTTPKTFKASWYLHQTSCTPRFPWLQCRTASMCSAKNH